MIRIKLSRILGEKRKPQAELARMTGIRPATISELYNEIATSISFENLDKICDALDCDVSDIIVHEKNTISEIRYRTGKPKKSDE
ncbi:MAG: helix-turn-helix transcriptional regulator [Lachnospiraceae bacterium]|nr:helix-turn-helix transcriptional regulator [Lachnospiraceae bacterium]